MCFERLTLPATCDQRECCPDRETHPFIWGRMYGVGERPPTRRSRQFEPQGSTPARWPLRPGRYDLNGIDRRRGPHCFEHGGFLGTLTGERVIAKTLREGFQGRFQRVDHRAVTVLGAADLDPLQPKLQAAIGERPLEQASPAAEKKIEDHTG